MSNENTIAPDESAAWYQERRADAIRQVEQSLSDLETRHSTIEQSHQDAEQREEQGHTDYDTRALVQAIRDKGRFEQEAAQISSAYSTLQTEKQRLEQHHDPRFDELLNSSSPTASQA